VKKDETVVEKMSIYRVLIGIREEKRQLERPRRRLEDNIETNLRGIGWVWTDSSDSGQRPVAGSCVCGNEL
jgi:hypothetical protein